MERRVITASTLMMVFMLLCGSVCLAEKLSPDQKAPLFAKGSGGLILKAPFEGGPRATDVGPRKTQTNPAPPAAPSAGPTQVDGVIREETVELKEVDGQLVTVVKGNFAYDSPEGLPIAVKYVADENGNRASFMFGTGKPGGGSGSSSGGQRTNKPGLTPGGPGATSLGGGGGSSGKGGRPGGSGGNGGTGSGGRPGGGQSGASTYLPPTTKVDRSYLPPN